MVGRHYTFVQQTLKSPEVRRVINDILEDVDQELANLAPLAVDALRGLLRSGSEGVKMQAAKLVLESQGKAKAPDGVQGKTAEDLVQSIMAQIEVEGKAVVRIGAASRSSPAALAAGDPDQIDENAGG